MNRFFTLLPILCLLLCCSSENKERLNERIRQREADQPLKAKLSAILKPKGLGICEVYNWIGTSEQDIRRDMEAKKGGALNSAEEFEARDEEHIKAWKDYCFMRGIPDSIRLTVITYGLKWCGQSQGGPINADSAYYARINAESKARIDAMTGDRSKELNAARAVLKAVLPNLKQTKDEFTGVTRYHAQSAPRFINKNGIDVYFASGKNAPPASLRWIIQYADEDWLFIERYLFNIDGEQYEYTPNKISRDNDGGIVWEWFDESVDEQAMKVLTALAKAKSAKIRFEGQDYKEDKPITKAQLTGIRQVLAVHEALATLHGN